MDYTTSIFNEMEGEWVDAPAFLIKMLRRYMIARTMFLLFAEHYHVQDSIVSCQIYMKLLDQWDNAGNELLPHANLFCILHKGWSLN